jgi:hypothetical protein
MSDDIVIVAYFSIAASVMIFLIVLFFIYQCVLKKSTSQKAIVNQSKYPIVDIVFEDFPQSKDCV